MLTYVPAGDETVDPAGRDTARHGETSAMADPIITALAALDEASTSSAFACRLKIPSEALALSVDGVGAIRFPVSKARARALVKIAKPAPFGHGERTLVDRRVRDVWEVAKSRVRIEARPWKASLKPALEKIRETLGLPAGRLEAKLHKLLVYESGQFFQPHRDTERDDTMIGTLVVVLPSEHRGGSLHVHHQGETRRFVARDPASPTLTLLAFYADCTHEVKPLTEGYRVVLSHELHFVREPEASRPERTEQDEALERALEWFFDPKRVPRESWRRPVEKLVYLLDHEYSPRSLSWERLKGTDNARVPALERTARTLGLHRHLALVAVDETWSAREEYASSRRWYGRGRYRGGYEQYSGYDAEFDEEDEEDEEDDDDRDGIVAGREERRRSRTVRQTTVTYELEELIECGASLDHWIGAEGRPADLAALHVDEEELRWLTDLERFEPEFEEYEGWMGNYGNTLERRYRRAAIVLWPARSHHRIRARMGAGPFVRELLQEARAGRRDVAREAVHAVIDDWPMGGLDSDASVLGDTLALLEALDDETLSLGLLSGFHLVALQPAAMPALIALGERHGAEFCRELLDVWVGAIPSAAGRAPSVGYRSAGLGRRLDWLDVFPAFCREVRHSAGDAWSGTPMLLFERLLALALEDHVQRWRSQRPSARRKAAPVATKRLVELLEAARATNGHEAEAMVIDALQAHHDDYLPETLVDVVEHLGEGKRKRSAALVESWTVLRERVAETLRVMLERSDRAADDWSLEASLDCDCEDCRTLAGFLAARDERALDLPLRKDRRAHLHRRIDERELPLEHETLRQGRPYVLQLRKRKVLFERTRREHRHARALLARLDG